MSEASTLDCEVEVPGSLAGLESQDQGHVPHPIAGGDVRPSCRAGFGRWDAVPVVTTWCYCLVRAGAHRDGVSPRDCCAFSPGRVSGACLSLSGHAYLIASVVSLSLPGVETKERSGAAA
jgi:hypothetical protein